MSLRFRRRHLRRSLNPTKPGHENTSIESSSGGYLIKLSSCPLYTGCKPPPSKRHWSGGCRPAAPRTHGREAPHRAAQVHRRRGCHLDTTCQCPRLASSASGAPKTSPPRPPTLDWLGSWRCRLPLKRTMKIFSTRPQVLALA